MLDISNFFHEELHKNKQAQLYLINRKISIASINRFNIGYWPYFTNDNNHRKVMVNSDFNKSDLFITNKLGVSYDAFPNSITIPILKNKEVYSFYCRSIDPLLIRGHHHLSNIDKYIFNEAAIEKSIECNEELFICEGIFDALSLEQLGYNAIATLSASINETIINLLENCNNINVCFDVDKKSQTGQKSANNIAKLLNSKNKNIKITSLPLYGDKTDVNSLLASGKEEKIVKSILKSKVCHDFPVKKLTTKNNIYCNDDNFKNLKDMSIIDVITAECGIHSSNKEYMRISCPFDDHNDSTPSFVVKGNRYKCFGCNKCGDTIQFIIDYRKVSFIEAIKILERYLNTND